tara:strand:+ start:431 stop:937 length:507 start_codon:yes stop_codon:yes gene_type:complete
MRTRFLNRIHRELDVLMGVYDVHVLEESNEIQIMIHDGNRRYFKMVITKDYPFKPPLLMYVSICCHEEKEYVSCIQDMLYFYVKKLNITYQNMCDNVNCLFCKSFVKNQWSPGNRMFDLLQERERMENSFKDVRSGYYATKALTKIPCVCDYIIEHICSYIYSRILEY